MCGVEIFYLTFLGLFSKILLSVKAQIEILKIIMQKAKLN